MNFISQLFETMNTMGIGISLIVAIPFLIVALVFVVMVIRSGRKVRASQNWQSTNGRILSSYVEQRRSSSGDGGTSTAYYAVVLYEYAANGKRLRSNRIHLGSEVGFGWTGQAQNTVNTYPEGALVEVYYNPENPVEAVLERTAGSSNRIFTCVAVFIIGMVIMTLALTFGGFALAQQFVNNLGIDRLLGGGK